jgi:SAM-dependent methyltransferase
MTAFLCASCGAVVTQTFFDLGSMPSANSYLRAEDLKHSESYWPLRAAVCANCFLVQLSHHVDPAYLFGSYAYYSSYADSWVEHARKFADDAIRRFKLVPHSRVLEIASNDGYLLRHFLAAGVPSLGIEPAANVARAAREQGIETRVQFFSKATANDLVAEGWFADLVVANNVLAHVPTINDFVAGLAIVLKPGGVLSVEFPHLLPLMERVEFDTIYHEHVFYYSLLAVNTLFARHGLVVFDVEHLSTHGGSLRVFAARSDGLPRDPQPNVRKTVEIEIQRGLNCMSTYLGFDQRAATCRARTREFFAECRRQKRRLVGYGAAAKGNTFLNYCGLGLGDLEFVADRNPTKQGTYLPGSHIPVRAPEEIFKARPDYVVILAWNLRDEIMAKLACIREWAGRFVTLIPDVEVLP